MAYYLDLFSPETWAAAQKNGFALTGFRERQRKQAARIQPGDIFLCYLVGLSRWCGALRVTSPAYEDATPYYSDPDPFTVRFKVEPLVVLAAENSVPIFLDSLWNHLSATREIPKGASGWAVGFRGSLRLMPDEDGELVIEHLAAQQQAPAPYPFSERDKRQLTRRAAVPSQKGDVLVEVPSEEDEEEAEPLATPTAPREESDDLRASLRVQATLARLGVKLGFKIWIAPGDRRKVGELLDADEKAALLERLPVNYETATLSTIEQIDVIWIKGRSIGRAFEVEHTTAIYSGLLRMADLMALQPNLDIKLHIVAPDDKREKVLRELRRPVFSLLERGPLYESCTYIAYSSLEEVAELPHLVRMSDGILDDFDEHAND